jgi:hypothetical protein
MNARQEEPLPVPSEVGRLKRVNRSEKQREQTALQAGEILTLTLFSSR